MPYDPPQEDLYAQIAKALGWTDISPDGEYGRPPGMERSWSIPSYTHPDDTSGIREMLAWLQCPLTIVRKASGAWWAIPTTPDGDGAEWYRGESLGHALGLLVLAVAEAG